MNILIVGCSLSNPNESHFSHDYLDQHYVRQIELKNHTVTNLSRGGQSNQKILLKTCTEISKQKTKYDLIIVQWSSLFRLNLNIGYSIYEDPANFSILGTTDQHKKFKSFWSTWCNNFLHPRIEILEWFSQIILLGNFLKNQNIPYVFVKGHDNFLNDLNKKNWKLSSHEFKSKVLLFDNYPDWEVDEIYSEMLLLYDIIKQNNWLNLFTGAWNDEIIDRAEDGLHAGPMSHNNYYKSLENYIKRLGLSY